jgi:hypothetical protein
MWDEKRRRSLAGGRSIILWWEVSGNSRRGGMAPKDTCGYIFPGILGYTTRVDTATMTEGRRSLSSTLGLQPEIALIWGEHTQEIGSVPQALAGSRRSLSSGHRWRGSLYPAWCSRAVRCRIGLWVFSLDPARDLPRIHSLSKVSLAEMICSDSRADDMDGGYTLNIDLRSHLSSLFHRPLPPCRKSGRLPSRITRVPTILSPQSLTQMEGH